MKLSLKLNKAGASSGPFRSNSGPMSNPTSVSPVSTGSRIQTEFVVVFV